MREIRLLRASGIPHRTALRRVHEPADAPLVHLVRRHDEPHVGPVVHQPHQQLLVGSPRRAGHEEAPVPAETLHQGHLAGCGGDFGHAVEARVAGHDHIVEAEPRQQAFRLLVLHEHHVETLQRLAPQSAVGAEKDRVGTEDGRHDVGPHPAAAQTAQEVEPELVLDEYGDFGTHDVEKAPGVLRRVDREIEDVIGPGVVLADFITRRRKESYQDLVLGVLAPQPLDDRPPLLELSERGDVHPHDALAGTDRLREPPEQVAAPLHPQLRFAVAQSGQPHDTGVEEKSEIINPHHSLYPFRMTLRRQI